MAVFLFIFFLLLVAYGILIEYYRKAWHQIPEFVADKTTPFNFISIIVAARNEESNLTNLFNSFEGQRYPADQFEVIIIDDHSTDNSWSIIQTHEKLSGNVKGLRLEKTSTGNDHIQSYKKFAIEKGIKMAKGELIVTTDADCIHHPDWLVHINSYYTEKNAKFIAAPVKIKATRSVLSVFQTLDFLTLQGITAASVFKRFHSMCNGANLAYEKRAFYEVDGFSGINNIPSGDDMLLMHKIYKKYPDQVFYLKSKSAMVTTKPVQSIKEFLDQRTRWASKADYYDDKRIFWVLMLVYAINVSFLVLAIAAFWNISWLFFIVLLLIAKTIIEFPFVNAVSIFFNQQNLMRYFALLQPVHILYTIITGMLGKFGSYEWKGRKVKNIKVAGT